ncbi:MAG TPA: EamA family transporter [Gemmatimonadaceae bacterium]|nr:EamA family transporter [Gemmatimonadaceae bacterium]
MTPSLWLSRWLRTAPAPLLVLCSVCITQVGSALAKTLFATLGTRGAVLVRVSFAALMLLAMHRPSLRRTPRRALGLAILFGVVLGAMNWSFYAALSRIPLGVAVTVEFVGPLGVAVLHSRRPRDLLWVALAAGGIALLAPVGIGGPDPIGLALATFAGVCWALYIILGARVGQAFTGGTGLSLAMVVASLFLAPGGVAAAAPIFVTPLLLLTGVAVAAFSSAIPYTLEMEALRRMPSRVFGVLMSLEPAVAAACGFLILGERLGPRALAAMLLITAASAGVTAEGLETA